jgi:tetratricopeptide (TPR) repeat protein
MLLELRQAYVGVMVATEQLLFHEATILSLEGRHAEAVPLLESIDVERTGMGWEAWRLNNLAWSLALSGRPDRGVETARASLDASAKHGNGPATTADLRGCQLGTLGTALVLAGRPEEGIASLEQALARGGTARLQATRAFFLGEGMHALGRHDEAVKAYRRATEEAPEAEYGRRSRTKLESLHAYRS